MFKKKPKYLGINSNQGPGFEKISIEEELAAHSIYWLNIEVWNISFLIFYTANKYNLEQIDAVDNKMKLIGYLSGEHPATSLKLKRQKKSLGSTSISMFWHFQAAAINKSLQDDSQQNILFDKNREDGKNMMKNPAVTFKSMK